MNSTPTAAATAAVSVAEGNKNNKISLRTSDGELFEVEKDVAMEIAIVKSFYELEKSASHDDMVMPLPNVESWELKKVIEYCTKYLDMKTKLACGDDKEMKTFEAEFVTDIEPKKLLKLANAANYLEVKYLLDFLPQVIANHISNKSVEYIREIFGIVNDYTPEEYEAVLAETAWAHEDVDED